jgi:hypothetical protein
MIADSLLGSSDPYAVVYSPELFPLSTMRGHSPKRPCARTSVMFQTLNCNWHDTTLVVKCPATFPTPGSLKGRNVTLAVFDFDLTSFDDCLGEVVLCLDDVVEAFERNVTLKQHSVVGLYRPAVPLVPDTDDAKRPCQLAFELPVILNGRHVGSLSGLVALHSPTATVANTNSNSPYMWKFRAVWEHFHRKYQFARPEKEGEH